MRRKKLTIIFFSVMVLTATPGAMHHFNDYVASAQNRAQVELLHFLLSFSTQDAATSLTAPQASQPQETTPCTEQTTASLAHSETGKARVAARANSAKATTQSRAGKRSSFNFEWQIADLQKGKELALDHLRSNAEWQRHVIAPIAPRAEFVKAGMRDATQANLIKVLMQTSKLRDKKAVRALERQLATFARANARAARIQPQMGRARADRDYVKPSEIEPAPATPNLNECGPVGEASML